MEPSANASLDSELESLPAEDESRLPLENQNFHCPFSRYKVTRHRQEERDGRLFGVTKRRRFLKMKSIGLRLLFE
jgi:hypothetical protein